MNPIVQAATIGVAGTVIVGVAGFGASIWNTRKTIATGQRDWIRDERAIAYVDAIAAVHYRQFGRQITAGTGPATIAAKREALASYKKPDWSVLEAHLLAFGSEPAFAAMQAASHAHLSTARASEAWAAVAGTEEAETLRARYESAIKDADDADDAFIEHVRAELQGKGPALSAWEPIAPVDGPTLSLP